MATLTVGANPWIWHSPVDTAALETTVPRLARWGFDAVELPLENAGDWRPEPTAALLRDHGVAPAAVVGVMPPGRDLVRTTPATVAATRDYLRRCVDAAHGIGAPVVAGPLYAAVGRVWRLSPAERAAAYEELRAGLAPVVEHARAAGVVLAIEPLNRYETSLLNTVAQTLTALDGLPPDGIGVALDTYHQNIEERSLPAAVHAAAGRVAHVQVCANDRGTPGADHLDWPGFLRALTTGGYQGPLCVESFTAHNETIAVAASVWRPLADGQDAIAVEGLAFLRRTIAAL
ncbi:sugar phosphate isomerase/epimerase family protein [Streptomyces radicis]|uniref:Sugar phosphate isomerase/epimerase n=1 Tax=Streptomyces radicis TaxID=1750517 RepID=A0A3A9VXA2_9ACTN|nr:sugar phosphate isomerase/epimerase family protein [Streptomyces radicis]RKN04793.1 sugar phosphate isomerase/epimerase [Streptomyces radicis]RKN15999.1 sugar phosphate isomerase/epimerase [Streptomyces radicis]